MSKTKSGKINPYIIISLLLIGLFVFIIFNRLTFAFKNVEKVLIESKKNTQTKKSFNLNNLEELKTKMPLQP
jgi:hypothetical protein